MAHSISPRGAAPWNPVGILRQVPFFGHTACVVIALAIRVVVGSEQASAQQTRNPAPASVTGAIRGRIVDASGRPVAKAYVQARSPTLRFEGGALTDIDGRYHIQALPTGRYAVHAEKATYIIAVYRTEPTNQTQYVDVVAGRTADRIDMTLARGGVVTGRVLDAHGVPLADVAVSLMRHALVHGERQLVSIISRPSNDIGEFRLYGVPSGQYYLAAALGSTTSGRDPTATTIGVNTANRPEYAPTYYPGTSMAADAQPLMVEANKTLGGITIALTPVRSVRVSGTVADASGRPPAHSMVSLRSKAVVDAATSGADGHFSFGNVPPGEYTLYAIVNGRTRSAVMTVTVGGTDVTGIQLTAVEPSIVGGRIVIDRAATGTITPADVWVGGTGGHVKVHDDFTFEQLPVHPGRAVVFPALSEGWILKAIFVDGVDVTNVGFFVAAGQTLRGVDLAITNQLGEISGLLADAVGSRRYDSSIIVFPQDRRKWTSQFVSRLQPDQNNRFSVKIPAGEYYAIALSHGSVPPLEGPVDPDELERISVDAIAFSLGEVEKKTLDLKLMEVPIVSSIDEERFALEPFVFHRHTPQPALSSGKESPARDLGVIRGRIVDRDTAQPLRRAIVQLAAPALREARVASTDDDGNYELTGLPVDRYVMTVTQAGYATIDGGMLHDVRADQRAENVDVSLRRGVVISGRVVDELGIPVPNAEASVLRSQFVEGRRRLTKTGHSARTNDLGEYRIYGLRPAQYYVSVTVDEAAMPSGADEAIRYGITYHPGVTDASGAAAIHVTPGQVATNVDVVVAPHRLSVVSGVVIDPHAPALAGVVQAIDRDGAFSGSPPTASIHPDGTFAITDVGPGRYMLRATVTDIEPGDLASAEVTVGSGDVGDVQLSVQPNGTVAGRIVVVDPGAAGAPVPPPTAFRVVTTAKDPALAAFPTNSGRETIDDDYRFVLESHPVKSLIRVEMPAGWIVKSIHKNGTDVFDAGVDVKPNARIDGITIEITTRMTDVSGHVTDNHGARVKEYTVVVFARDRERWKFGTRYVQTGRPDQAGRFKIRGLPPGDYFAVAVDDLEPGASGDPEYLDKVRGKATSFSLGDGEGRTLDLQIRL